MTDDNLLSKRMTDDNLLSKRMTDNNLLLERMMDDKPAFPARMPDAIKALRERFRNHTPGLMDAQRAYAVLCPLIDAPDGPELLFEVRAAGIRQGGEVCFPGGRIEPGETPLQCALRETEEELSIPRDYITPLGRMDFICNQRGFLLHPVPGLLHAEGLRYLRASAAEVSETFTAPLSFFRDTPPELYAYELVPRPPEGFPYDKVGVASDYPWAPGKVHVPVWYWRGHAIWGMTARITAYLVRGL